MPSHDLNTVLRFKITTAFVRSVTLNSSASACPATQTICPAESTITGWYRARTRSTFASTKKSCSFFRPRRPRGRKLSPGRRFRTDQRAPSAGPPPPPPRRRGPQRPSSRGRLARRHDCRCLPKSHRPPRAPHLARNAELRRRIRQPGCGFAARPRALLLRRGAATTVHAVPGKIERA